DSAGPLVVEMPFRITDRVASLGRGLVLGLRRGGLVCRRRRRVRPVLVAVGLGGRRVRICSGVDLVGGGLHGPGGGLHGIGDGRGPLPQGLVGLLHGVLDTRVGPQILGLRLEPLVALASRARSANVSDSATGQETQSLLHRPAPLRRLPPLSPALRDTDPGIGWDQRTGTVSCLTSLYRVVARRVRSGPDGYGRGLRVRPGGGGGRSPGGRPEACAQPTLGCCWVMQWIPPPRA